MHCASSAVPCNAALLAQDRQAMQRQALPRTSKHLAIGAVPCGGDADGHVVIGQHLVHNAFKGAFVSALYSSLVAPGGSCSRRTHAVRPRWFLHTVQECSALMCHDCVQRSTWLVAVTVSVPDGHRHAGLAGMSTTSLARPTSDHAGTVLGIHVHHVHKLTRWIAE
jgi:hypothetical protein